MWCVSVSHNAVSGNLMSRRIYRMRVTGGNITGPTKPPPAAPRRATANNRDFVLIQSAYGSGSSGGSSSSDEEGQDVDGEDMLSIQLMSDLYLEPQKSVGHRFSVGATHLALLGNLGSIAKNKNVYFRSVLMRGLLPKYEVVLMVPGNAEVHGTSWGAMMRDMDKFQKLLAAKRGKGARLGTFCLLNRTTYVFSNSPLPSSSFSPSPSPSSSSSSSSEGDGSDGDGDGQQQQGGRDIAVLGCPLFSHIPDSEAEKTSFGQNDFLLTRDWSVEKHNAAHAADLAWLNRRAAELERDETVGAVVIMTHWSPTTHPRTRSGRESFREHGSYFATDLSREPCWNSAKVRAWCWGHTHRNVDMLLPRGEGGSLLAPIRVMSNQMGFGGRGALAGTSGFPFRANFGMDFE
ncbi:hypothetical protein N3K66_007350 [Trichothecium roseum]|uniref:Uncharacterized protein n=1 Tax=Trichothecium roseum TaxID=47278 RepID=A0ACC0UVF5_9HYPO|nr:hypothetical protein N3K66_007350 [Trichothecium roseum]